MNSAKSGIQFLLTTSQRIITWSGYLAALLSVVLVLMIVTDVVLRYIAGETSVWIVELEWHMFALIFLLGAAFTMQKDGHVRVDVLMQKFSDRNKRLINLLGHIFLLIPLCLFMIPPAWDYFYQSWSVAEASGDPGGLPALYSIKAFIPVAFILVLIQAGAEVVRIILDLFFPEMLIDS